MNLGEHGGSSFGRTLATSGLLFLTLTSLAWILFTCGWNFFPYVRNGTRIIVDAKRQAVARQELFAAQPTASPPVGPEVAGSAPRFRIAFFGHSRVLSGFQPRLFDSLTEGRTCSYNLGMPGENEFLPRLEETLAAGNRPTHVWVILPWPAEEFTPTVWKWFGSDQRLLQKVFPFQPLAKDLTAFVARAPSQGGFGPFYRFSAESASKTLTDRGYYFIESQSLFPDHRLPDDYRHPSDHPDRADPRDVPGTGRPIERVAELARQYRFRVVLVPNYRRAFQAAPPPKINSQTVDRLSSRPEFLVVGPDYFRYPNSLFSDRVHLNPEGADRYTRDLWELTRGLFTTETNPNPTPRSP